MLNLVYGAVVDNVRLCHNIGIVFDGIDELVHLRAVVDVAVYAGGIAFCIIDKVINHRFRPLGGQEIVRQNHRDTGLYRLDYSVYFFIGNVVAGLAQGMGTKYRSAVRVAIEGIASVGGHIIIVQGPVDVAVYGNGGIICHWLIVRIHHTYLVAGDGVRIADVYIDQAVHGRVVVGGSAGRRGHAAGL